MLFNSPVDVSDLTTQQLNGLIAIAVAIDTLYCFLGYRTLRFVLGLTGFLMAGGVAVLGGLVALLLERPVIMLATAALGAWMVVSGVAYFIVGSGEQEGLTEFLQSEDQRMIVIASWAVLAVAGALSQVATTKKKVKAA